MDEEGRYAPRALLFWALAVLIIAASTRNPWLLLLLLAGLFGFAWRSGKRVPWRTALWLVGLSAFWNMLTVHVGRHILFRLPMRWPVLGGPHTLEALCYGGANGLALSVIVAAFGLVFALLSPREIARMVPPAFYEAGLVLSVALAFFPQGRESLAAIREAQQVRGYRGRGWRDLPPLLFPLLTLALEEALSLADSLEARGFVSQRPPLPRLMRVLFFLALLLPLAGSAAVMVGRWKRWGEVALALGLGMGGVALHLAGRGGGRRGGPPPVAHGQGVQPVVWAALLALIGQAVAWMSGMGTMYSPYQRLLPPPPGLLPTASVLLLWMPGLFPPRQGRAGVRPRATVAPRRPAAPPIHFRELSFAYPDAEVALFRELSLTIPPGSFALVVGASGSGKSTFLRMINGLVPQSSGGWMRGRICVGDLDTRLGTAKLAPWVGMVIQRPERSFIAEVVEEEVAFAPEQAGFPPEVVAARVEEALDRMGIAHLRGRRIATLSGGEKQLLALAAALALRPPILLLDEPMSQLDEVARASLIRLLQRLHEEGMTVIIAEHRLQALRPLATQVIRLGEPRAVPPLPPLLPAGERVVLRVEGLTVGYEDRPPVLQGVDLTLRQGEIVALIAPNGAGKSTLFRAIIGLLPLRRGRIFCCGASIESASVEVRARQIGYLPQDPDLLLFAESVADEVRFTLRHHGLPDDEEVVMPLLAQLGLAEVAGAYPRDLSLGQRQRVALAAVMAPRPSVLLLDEPTRGLDTVQAAALGGLLRRWAASGMSVLLATHNRAWAMALAHRTVGLEGKGGG